MNTKYPHNTRNGGKTIIKQVQNESKQRCNLVLSDAQDMIRVTSSYFFEFVARKKDCVAKGDIFSKDILKDIK